MLIRNHDALSQLFYTHTFSIKLALVKLYLYAKECGIEDIVLPDETAVLDAVSIMSKSRIARTDTSSLIEAGCKALVRKMLLPMLQVIIPASLVGHVHIARIGEGSSSPRDDSNNLYLRIDTDIYLKYLKVRQYKTPILSVVHHLLDNDPLTSGMSSWGGSHLCSEGLLIQLYMGPTHRLSYDPVELLEAVVKLLNDISEAVTYYDSSADLIEDKNTVVRDSKAPSKYILYYDDFVYPGRPDGAETSITTVDTSTFLPLWNEVMAYDA